VLDERQSIASIDGCISLQNARRFSESVLIEAGLGAKDASIVSDVLVRTSARGIATHGIRMLPLYVNKLQNGGLNPKATISTIRSFGGTAVLDADGGCGHAAAVKAVEVGSGLAHDHGISIVLVRNSNHFGAAGHYTLMAAEKGLVAQAWSNTAPAMRVTNSKGRVLGNSPTAYGAANPSGMPIVFDVAMSVAAGSKVHMATERGEQIPLGWLVDSDGHPTTDPRSYTAGGALVPVGEHKGYGFALLGELMAGVLSGAAIAAEIMRSMHQPVNVGHAFIFIAPTALMEETEYIDRVARLVAQVHEAPPAPGATRVYVPGEMEYESELLARESGIPVDAVTTSALSELDMSFIELIEPLG
jgi:LDH2 family malate/lactate/ureidoglycolate dehydrogenase